MFFADEDWSYILLLVTPQNEHHKETLSAFLAKIHLKSPQLETLNQKLVEEVRGSKDSNQIKALIEKGANPNVFLEKNTSPVLFALDSHNGKLAKLFLENGGNPLLSDDQGLRSVFWDQVGKALVNKWKKAKFKPVKNPNVLKPPPAYEEMDWVSLDIGLETASQSGDVEEVKHLLSKGADPNHRGKDGKTPIEKVNELIPRFEEVDLGTTDLKLVKSLLENAPPVDPRKRKAPGVFEPFLLSNVPERFKTFPLAGQMNIAFPTIQNSITPIFPERAKKIGYQGWVELAICIDVMGEVTDVEVTRQLGKGKFEFEEEAKKAILKTRWDPATLDENPLTCVVGVKVHFRLED